MDQPFLCNEDNHEPLYRDPRYDNLAQREVMLAFIESYVDVVFEVDAVTVNGLRRKS